VRAYFERPIGWEHLRLKDEMVRCACGVAYVRAGFNRLPLVGYYHVPADEMGPEEKLVSRNCACGSTLTAELEG